MPRRKYGVVRIKRDTYSNAKVDWKEIRQRVLERDNFRCVDCGADLRGIPQREVHHIKSLTSGGRTVMSNLKLLCLICHNKKHKHLSRNRQ